MTKTKNTGDKTMPKKKTERKQYKPFQVPYKIYLRLETKASKLRQETGQAILWTDLLKKCIMRGMKRENISE